MVCTHLDIEYLPNRSWQRLDCLPDILQRSHRSAAARLVFVIPRDEYSLLHAGAGDGVCAAEEERGEDGEDLRVDPVRWAKDGLRWFCVLLTVDHPASRE